MAELIQKQTVNISRTTDPTGDKRVTKLNRCIVDQVEKSPKNLVHDGKFLLFARTQLNVTMLVFYRTRGKGWEY